jgi:hypothetical protein
MSRPTIVCLCGSTRFYEEFQAANYRETMAGRIVLSVGFYPHCSERAHGEPVGCTDEQKAKLDELHLRKIDLADEVLVLNVLQRTCPACGTPWRHDRIQVQKCSCGAEIGDVQPTGYVGDSTRREIEYARRTGKRIRWLERREGE